MTFLRNAWYAAGWEQDLGADPVSRTMLDEPIVLYRDEAGAPVALADACPHRFAPLSLGKVLGDRVQCPYHGLVFDKTGACVHNPNGRGQTPSALAVRSYPVQVSNGMIWLWFGDAEKALETKPPQYEFLERPEWPALRGYLHVQANYELVTDNLLDLSHAEFLHPFIVGPGGYNELRYNAEQVGQRVSAYHHMPDAAVTPLLRPFFDASVTKVTGRAHMHWEAPANMMLDVGAVALDGAANGDDVALPQTHLLTPETATTTHYFWSLARSHGGENARLDQALSEGISYAFEHEDEPMIRAVHERMKGRSLFDLAPALLPQDEAAVRARRVLAKAIVAEQGAASNSKVPGRSAASA